MSATPGSTSSGAEHRRARRGRLRQPGPVAGRLADRVGDERGRLGHVEAQAAGSPGAGQFGRREDQQPVAIRRCQAHGLTLFGATLLAWPRIRTMGLNPMLMIRLQSTRDRCTANAPDRQRSGPRYRVAIRSRHRDRMAQARDGLRRRAAVRRDTAHRDRDGVTEVELQRGVSYARQAGAEHNVISTTPSEFAFVEIELKADSSPAPL